MLAAGRISRLTAPNYKPALEGTSRAAPLCSLLKLLMHRAAQRVCRLAFSGVTRKRSALEDPLGRSKSYLRRYERQGIQ
jgi:hypothetical protein